MNAKSEIRALKSALSTALSATLVLGVCWGAAIGWWRDQRRVPATWELIVCLCVLPIGLLLAFWGGRRVLAGSSGNEAGTADAAPQPVPHGPPPRPPVLAIVAAALRLPHGKSTQALANALAGQRAGAEPDPELVDDAGLPVMTARSRAAGAEVLRDDILAWLAANGLAELRYSAEQWRALILATQVTAELAGQAMSLLPASGDPSRPLRLIPLLPDAWASAQRRAAGQWLEHTVAQCGWPAARIERARSTLPGPDETSPAAPFVHLAHEAVLTNAPLSALIVACDSHVGGATVARWEADGCLFTASQLQGRVPGEGAAGVLVLDERQARLLEGAAGVRLDALQEARRENAVDAGRHVDPAPLAGVVRRALEHAGVAPADVAMVVADTGERTRRVLELMGAVAALSRLDPSDDIVRVGIASGDCGVVAFIAALALARHHALARAAPVLCVSNEDAVRRIAAVVRPAPPRSHSMP